MQCYTGIFDIVPILSVKSFGHDEQQTKVQQPAFNPLLFVSPFLSVPISCPSTFNKGYQSFKILKK